MKPLRVTKPKLETLESRWVPATIKLIGGNLFVSNQTGALTITVSTTPGKVEVDDNGSAVTVNGVGGLIAVRGTNKSDSITFNGNTGFKGNVLINSGNGNDTITLKGQIAGNLTIRTGAGNDVVTASKALTVGGNFNYFDPLGLNKVIQNNKTFTIGGNYNLVGVSQYKTGVLNQLKVGGNFNLSAGATSPGPNVFTFSGLFLNVGNSVNVSGSAVSDTFTLVSKLNVGGSFTANLGEGTNTFTFTPLLGGSGVGGNVSYTGGSGTDTFSFGSTATLAGNLALDLGNGTNTFLGLGGSIVGDVSVVGGSDTNITVLSPLMSIGGDLSFALGNGTNSTTITNTGIGGIVGYVGGNGTDTLTLFPLAAATYDVDVLFGTGTATLTLNGNVTLTGKVVGSTGSYTFNQGGATLLPTLELVNFP